MTPVRAILADDHDIFRRGLAQLLRDEGIDVIGEASRGRTAVKLITELSPEVALIDLSMPDMGGLEATRQITASGCPTRVVILSINDDDESMIEALMAGAVGYLQKDESLESIITAVHGAANGDALIPRRIGNEVLRRLREHKAPEDARQEIKLSERELEVLRLVVEGYDNASISRQLHISPHTVKNHVAKVIDKLGVSNRLSASVEALRRGLIR
jgi:DNA-binding NarL/FixJ family response regulator